MEDLYELLNNPFENIPKGNAKLFQKKCAEIARKLFCGYCIKCDAKKFYFAEIEFYYYEKGAWDAKWNEVTYARDGYKKGDLFYHLSGIDICFESHYSHDNARFGGILIRAIKDENDVIITGPLTCKNEILNACKHGSMPKLISFLHENDIDVKSTYRALGKDDIDMDNDRLCFYDSCIIDWNPVKIRYNTRKDTIESKRGTYNTKRFYVNH